ncbi:MAG: hypothetical protein LBN04_02315 [Oscillospiraceae bacterium]|nr:hypothetical protein [Oscillospiraceae bacterium]
MIKKNVRINATRRALQFSKRKRQQHNASSIQLLVGVFALQKLINGHFGESRKHSAQTNRTIRVANVLVDGHGLNDSLHVTRPPSTSGSIPALPAPVKLFSPFSPIFTPGERQK